MTINISPEDAKLFEQNGFSKEKVGQTINHYREMGMSDSDIQVKMDTKINEWKNPNIEYNKSGELTKPLNIGISSFDWNNAQEEIKKDPGQALRGMVDDTNRRGNIVTNSWKGGIQGLSKLGVGLGKNFTNKVLRPMVGKKPLTDAELDNLYGFLDDKPQGLGKATAFIGENAPYFMLPEARVLEGAGLGAKTVNSGLTGLYQGGLIGGVESLANEGDLSGVVPGAVVGGGLGVAIPGGGELLVKSAKPVGEGLKWFASKATSLSPATIEQAIKPNSQALDLTEKTAQNLLMNTTERVRRAYNHLLGLRGENVGNVAKKLKDIDVRVKADDLIGDITSTFDQYGGDRINPARNMTGKLEQNLTDLVNSGTNEDILNDIVQNQTNRAMSSYSPVKESEALDIISTVTGKDKNWIKSRLYGGAKNSKTVMKQGENVSNGLEDVADRIETEGLFMDKGYKYYNPEGNPQDLVNQAYDDLVNSRFKVDSVDPLEMNMNKVQDEYNRLLGNVNSDYKNFDTITNATEEFYNKTNILPEDLRAEYLNNFLADAERIYNARNTVSPTDLNKMREQIGKMVNWSDEVAQKYNNPILEQVYGKFSGRLNEISPELAKANNAYEYLRNFKKNEGLRKILSSGDNIDSASSTLRNYNSTVTKGNTGKNIQELEDVLAKNGYGRFLNEIDDVNAAMDLQKRMETGLNFLGANNILRSLVSGGLRGARALNRNQGLQTIYNGLGQEMPSWLIPTLYGVGNGISE